MEHSHFNTKTYVENGQKDEKPKFRMNHPPLITNR